MGINPLTYSSFNGGFPNNEVHHAGADTLVGKGGADLVFGDVDPTDPTYDPSIHKGFDVIVWNSSDDNDILLGEGGNDALAGHDGQDVLNGDGDAFRHVGRWRRR